MMWNWRDKGLWLEKTLNTSMLSTPTKWKPPSDCWVNESQSYSTAGNLGLCLRSCSDKQPHRAQDQEFLSRADWVRSVPICKGLMNLKNCWPPVENSAAAPESCPWPAACPGASTKPSSSLRHGLQPQESSCWHRHSWTLPWSWSARHWSRSAENMGSSLLCVMVSHHSHQECPTLSILQVRWKVLSKLVQFPSESQKTQNTWEQLMGV